MRWSYARLHPTITAGVFVVVARGLSYDATVATVLGETYHTENSFVVATIERSFQPAALRRAPGMEF